MSSDQNNSASHWCKTVVEAVVPKANLMPPPPPPVKNPTIKATKPTNLNKVALSSLNNETLSSQYLNLYQQIYNTSDISVSNESSTGNNLRANQPATYASVLSNSISNSTTLASTLSKPISAPWGNAYSYQMPTKPVTSITMPSYHTVPPTAAAAVNIQIPSTVLIKKPNPTRFSSVIVSETYNNNTSNITSTIPHQVFSKQLLSSITTQQQQQQKPPNAQPDSLKLYVQRSFASCCNDIEREYVSNVLKALITKVTADGRLHIHKWDLEPIPKYDPALVINKTLQTTSTNYNSSPRGTLFAKALSYNSIYGPATTSETINNDNNNDSNNSNKQDNKKKKREIKVADNEESPPLKKSVLAGVDKLNTDTQEIKMREMRQSRFKYDENNINMSYMIDATNTLSTSRTQMNKKNKKISLLNNTNNNNLETAMTEYEMESLKIIGACTKLEKDYLRLTSAPHPNVVRPEHILRKSIQLIKSKWASDEVDYVYMCSQLKSIRQDLTVQHIQNDFTVHVYETHARVALECDDMNEYNQCQTQLKQLYSLGYKGSEMEFIAYRILYYVYLLGNKKYTGGSSDLAHLMTSLSTEAYKNLAVIHALNIRQAIQLENSYKFFKLYKETPNMGNYILDLMIDNWRIQALQKICKVYKPDVPIKFIITLLAFENNNIGLKFLKKVGCILINNDMKLNTKDTIVDGSLLQSETKLLL